MRIFPLVVLAVFMSQHGWSAKTQSVDLYDVPAPFYASYGDMDPNLFVPLHDGMVSFQLRLDLINGAEKGEQIEVEYFIYRLDESGRLLTQALVRAAKRGVKVRILLDKSIGTFYFNKYYAAAVAEHGIETKYYNGVPLVRVSTAQFRNHRKLLLVGNRAITGGRNIGNEYFGIDSEYNFHDRDVFVYGEVVDSMRASFDEFWQHKRSKSPRQVKVFKKKWAKAQELITESDADRELLAKIENLSRDRLNHLPKFWCDQTEFVSDAPGATFFKRLNPSFRDKHKHVRKVLYHASSEIKESLLVATPYFIQNRKAEGLLNNVLRRNDGSIPVEVFTNSLASTDHSLLSASLYKELKGILKQGLQMHVHSGQPLREDSVFTAEAEGTAWGVHSKTHVYDGKHVFIGTYNVDNRSDFYNSEMGVLCYNNVELAQNIESSIRLRMDNGLQVISRKKAIDPDGNEVSSLGKVSRKKIRKMLLYYLPAWLLKPLL